MSQVLVTGGNGFIAGWCIVQLLEAGHDVVVTVRSPAKEETVRVAVRHVTDPAALRFAVADLMSDDGWDRATAVDTIVDSVRSLIALGAIAR